MKNRNIVFSFVSLFVAVCVLTWFLAPSYKPNHQRAGAEKGQDTEQQISTLFACIMADKCTTPRTVEKVKEVPVYGVVVRLPKEGLLIKYMMIGDRLAVLVAKDNQNQITINDVNLDGVVDYVHELRDGKSIVYRLDEEHVQEMVIVQAVYFRVLQIAWDKVVSPEIKEANTRDLSRWKS